MTATLRYVLLLCLGLAACLERKPLPVERSPSGAHTMVVDRRRSSEGGEELLVSVVDAHGARATLDRAYATGHRLVFSWDADERIWVYSSDVGTYVYELRGGRWTELDAAERRALEPPPRIREVPMPGGAN